MDIRKIKNKMEQYFQDDAIVLKAEPIGEYDRRMVLLTKDHGKISAFAKGARRQTNKLMGSTDLFCFGLFDLIDTSITTQIRQKNISTVACVISRLVTFIFIP